MRCYVCIVPELNDALMSGFAFGSLEFDRDKLVVDVRSNGVELI